MPSDTFAGYGYRAPVTGWTVEMDHALLEARAQVDPDGGPSHPGQAGNWAMVAQVFTAMTGKVLTIGGVSDRWRRIIREMETDLALARARMRAADELAARALMPPPVPVAPTWPGLMAQVRATIPPSQERISP